jgi:hypothetical protein
VEYANIIKFVRNVKKKSARRKPKNTNAILKKHTFACLLATVVGPSTLNFSWTRLLNPSF